MSVFAPDAAAPRLARAWEAEVALVPPIENESELGLPPGGVCVGLLQARTSRDRIIIKEKVAISSTINKGWFLREPVEMFLGISFCVRD